MILSAEIISLAAERERASFSISSRLGGGLMGIKDSSYSPLSYNGPQAGMGLGFSVHRSSADIFVDLFSSYGWLGNQYHRDFKSMHTGQINVTIGSMATMYEGHTVSVKAGGALGFLEIIQLNREFSRFHHTIAFDARACLDVTLKLNEEWSFVIEDRIPFVSYSSPSNRISTAEPTPSFDFTWIAFPGNDLTTSICRSFDSGNRLMFFFRHFCYSSGNVLTDCFQFQFIQLGVKCCFNF